MLVLTRRLGETLYAKDNKTEMGISITVLDVAGGQVRIGIDAPKNVSIQRDDMKSGPSKQKR